VSYIAGVVPCHAHATTQSLFTGTAFSAGAVAGSVLGGAMTATPRRQFPAALRTASCSPLPAAP
jgi:hypothetical protein